MSTLTTDTHFIFLHDVNAQFPDKEENIREYIDYCEANGISYDEDNITDEEIEDFLNSTNEGYWYDMENEIEYYEKEHGKDTYIMLGHLGFWDGIKKGYNMAQGLKETIGRAWSGCDECDVYIEDGQLRMKAFHHDGTNLIHIKVLTKLGLKYYFNHVDDVKMTNKELYAHIFNSNRLSKEVRVFHDIYGWK